MCTFVTYRPALTAASSRAPSLSSFLFDALCPPMQSTKIERLVCCNVLASDEISQTRLFRHPFYSYDGPITWPPERWKEGRCNYCAHPFDRPGKDGERVFVPPVPLPCFHDKQSNEWRVSGMFCTWNCAKAELLSVQGYASGGGALLLDQLARTIFGYTGGEILPAPPRTCLAFFYPGPDALDIDTFRSESADFVTIPLRPPLISLPEIYERHACLASSPWSVKGIRMKKQDSDGQTTRGEHKGARVETVSMFDVFLEQKKAGSGKASGSKGDEGKNKEATFGTLLDWRDMNRSVGQSTGASSSDPV